ncbi:hypothetical protein JCM11957_06450 [Caminibacter profundus]
MTLALISAIASMVFYILIKGFSTKIFVLMNFLFINFIISVFILVKLYRVMSDLTEQIKEN